MINPFNLWNANKLEQVLEKINYLTEVFRDKNSHIT